MKPRPTPLSVQEAKNIIEQLTHQILEAEQEYYSGQQNTLDDRSFDLLTKELACLEKQFPELALKTSPTQKVGQAYSNDFRRREHSIPMLSLSNAYTEEDLEHWYYSVQKTVHEETVEVFCELKIDGLALAVTYQEGKLQTALTRGDGEFGEDITKNARQIQRLPQDFALPQSIDVRGEVFFYRDQFEKINQKRAEKGEPLFKNPRNTVAGSIRVKNPKDLDDRQPNIFIYDIVTQAPHDFHDENLQFLKKIGFTVPPHGEKKDTFEAILQYCQYWEKKKEELPFDIDGVVLKVNRLSHRKILGNRSKSPRWAIAWKFSAQQARSRLLSIEHSVGRTGTVTPVANLAPVQLLSTTVKRATLHNYDQIKRLDIRLNDTLFIEKGGEIIPKVVGVDYKLRLQNAPPLEAPFNCPVCSSPLISLQEEVDIRCVNNHCPSIVLGALEHFVSQKAFDIQFLGPANLTLFFREGFIQKISDIFRLHKYKPQLLLLEGFGVKSIDNLLVSLENAKNIPLHKFIFALGIRYVGEKASKILAGSFQSIENLMNLKKEDLEKITAIGPVMIQSLLTWFEHPDNRKIIHELLNLGVAPFFRQNTKSSFIGQSVVLTGTLSLPREAWKEKLEAAGFSVSSAVSAKTTYLLAGEKAGSKLSKAQKIGVIILNEQDMEKFLSSHSLI